MVVSEVNYFNYKHPPHFLLHYFSVLRQIHAHFPSTTRTTASKRMENHFSTFQEASTTRASLGNIGRTGCSRCTWLDSTLFRCTWNRAKLQTLSTYLCFTSCQKSFKCFHAGMCRGTSMRLCRVCLTLLETETLSTS